MYLCFALQIFWALGTVFEVLLAILVMPTLGWRWLLGLSTIPLFIFAFLCFVSMMLSEVLQYVCRTNDSFISWRVCFLVWVWTVATRERSIRRADRKSGESSGHIEAHCYREWSTHATGKTYCCQTGKSQFLQNIKYYGYYWSVIPVILSLVYFYVCPFH